MVVLTAETCWALNEYWIYNKISGIKLVSLYSTVLLDYDFPTFRIRTALLMLSAWRWALILKKLSVGNPNLGHEVILLLDKWETLHKFLKLFGFFVNRYNYKKFSHSIFFSCVWKLTHNMFSNHELSRRTDVVDKSMLNRNLTARFCLPLSSSFCSYGKVTSLRKQHSFRRFLCSKKPGWRQTIQVVLDARAQWGMKNPKHILSSWFRAS